MSYIWHRSTVAPPDVPLITFVGGMSGNVPASTGTNTTFSLTSLDGGFDNEPAAGDLVIVGYGANNNNSGFNVQMITAGYTEQADMQSPTNTFDSHHGDYTKIMSGSPDTEFTVGPTGSSADVGSVVAGVLRGVHATPLDVAIVTGGSSGVGGQSRPNPGAITPVTDRAMICVIGHTCRVNAFTALPGLVDTRIQTNGGTIGMGFHEWRTGDGAFNPDQFTGGTTYSDSGCTWIVMAFKPA